MGKIKTIGILTSGGDAPGMNAAIRAVTRSGICNGFHIKGIYRGYDGLIHNEIADFTTENVSGIIMLGGTILKSARSHEFMTVEGRQKAYENMVKAGIDALVVIGGNGSLTGAMLYAQEHDVCCIGLPGTIDNDLYGTDSTIGYDTTLNTIDGARCRFPCTKQCHRKWRRGSHYPRRLYRRRPISPLHGARHPQIQEELHRHRVGKSQVWCPLLC